MRGYFGIGIYHTKTEINVGTLWRSAHNFGAAFIFTIGKRYKRQSSDTTKAWKSIPLYHYENYDDFRNGQPFDCPVVAIEQTKTSTDIMNFVHPERVIYLLGAEDHGISESILKHCFKTIHINTPMCLNVAVAGSIIVFDRSIKTK